MGFQNTIVETSLPSFPWTVGDKVYAVPLNNELISLQNQIDNLMNILALLQFRIGGGSSFGTSATMNWGGGNVTTPGTYIITGSAAYQFLLGTMVYSVGDNGGSFTASVTINHKPVLGLTNILVSSAGKNTATASDNFSSLVLMGDEVDVIISNVVGAPKDGFITLNSVPPQVVPQLGVGVGFANGTSTASAVSITFNAITGQASGSSTALGVIMLVQPGQSVGFAAGTSTAIAINGSRTAAPTLILDDPAFGSLDVNPLG